MLHEINLIVLIYDTADKGVHPVNLLERFQPHRQLICSRIVITTTLLS